MAFSLEKSYKTVFKAPGSPPMKIRDTEIQSWKSKRFEMIVDLFIQTVTVL